MALARLPLDLFNMITRHLSGKHIVLIFSASQEIQKRFDSDTFWKNRGAYLMNLTVAEFSIFYSRCHLANSISITLSAPVNFAPSEDRPKKPQTLMQFCRDIESFPDQWIVEVDRVKNIRKNNSLCEVYGSVVSSLEETLPLVYLENLSKETDHGAVEKTLFLNLVEEIKDLVIRHEKIQKTLSEFNYEPYISYVRQLVTLKLSMYKKGLERAGYSSLPRCYHLSNMGLKGDLGMNSPGFFSPAPKFRFKDTPDIQLPLKSKIRLDTFLEEVYSQYVTFYTKSLQQFRLSKEIEDFSPDHYRQFMFKYPKICEFDMLTVLGPYSLAFTLYVFIEPSDGQLYLSDCSRGFPEESLKLFKIAKIRYYDDLYNIYGNQTLFNVLYNEESRYILSKIQVTAATQPINYHGHKIYLN
jgi:hypothetical protein